MSERLALLQSLAKNGVQYGHQTWRWNPKMAPYIWGQKNGIHLIDLSKTAYQLEKAAKFLEEVATAGKPILWCGTKKAAQTVLEQALTTVKCPVVSHRWIGGTLTNYAQVKKSVTKLLHLEDILAKSENSHYTKKELNVFQKMVERLNKNIGGIRHLMWPVGAVVIVDVKKEHVALKEALSAGVPVVALVDTNSDPSMIDYVIPSNDDAPRAISVIINHLAQAVARGQVVAAAKPQEETSAENTIEQMLAHALGMTEEAESAEKNGKKRPVGARQPRRSPAGRGPARR